jgi:phosphatidylserine/phosphatidylglycerophosphate/cardiolipin synthase-like enzyme
LKAIRRLYSKAFVGGALMSGFWPWNSDVALADWLREGIYPSLMDDGIKFHEYQGRVLHAKSMVCEDRLAVAGSANFEDLSISMNWELGVVDDPTIVSQLIRQDERDLESRVAVDWDWAESRPWWRRAFLLCADGSVRRSSGSSKRPNRSQKNRLPRKAVSEKSE